MKTSRVAPLLAAACNLLVLGLFLLNSGPLPPERIAELSPQVTESGNHFEIRGSLFMGWVLVAGRIFHPAALPPLAKLYVLFSLPAIFVTTLIAWPLRAAFPSAPLVSFSWVVAGLFALASSSYAFLLARFLQRLRSSPRPPAGV